ncbi:MAG: aspartate-semialdehyde dehydrogenase [Bacteroidales bacterium]|jgi:aspartate-semialdehyde dehydrogenase|nr:aspartate-semialdehyde dehydrogenase [Bacteroidales bacterium]
MKVAVIGATGMVGRMMLKVLEEREFPVDRLFPAASERSAGREVIFRGKPVRVVSVMEAVEAVPDVALFSAGAGVSKEWAPVFAENGTVVIDNSSAWRMEEGIPLVVPEINAAAISADTRIIANPNCSTIQMLMAIAPLHREFGIKRLVISTYQSVTGTGVKAVTQLDNERRGLGGEMAYPYPIDLNCIPQCDIFMDNGYTKEEMKLVNETHKILGDDSIRVTATAVRVPVKGGHSESVNIEFLREFDLDRVRALLSATPGVILYDDPAERKYPMPLTAHDRDEVFVGRLRRDFSQEKTLNLWVVADNIRKGAATNAVQIAEYMISAGLLK